MRAFIYVFIAVLACAAQAQPAPVEIALQVGATKYQFSGNAECKAAPQASIYGISAALYSVTHSAGGQSLHLTLWQPKNASPDMMTLTVSNGSNRYEVDTVKGANKRDTKGSGKTTVEKSGAGGVFKLEAVAAKGEKISGTIKCARFSGVQAEGG
jgi:hypothetical protein